MGKVAFVEGKTDRTRSFWHVTQNTLLIQRSYKKQLIINAFNLKQRRPPQSYQTHKTPDAFPFDDLRLPTETLLILGCQDGTFDYQSSAPLTLRPDSNKSAFAPSTIFIAERVSHLRSKKLSKAFAAWIPMCCRRMKA